MRICSTSEDFADTGFWTEVYKSKGHVCTFTCRIKISCTKGALDTVQHTNLPAGGQYSFSFAITKIKFADELTYRRHRYTLIVWPFKSQRQEGKSERNTRETVSVWRLLPPTCSQRLRCYFWACLQLRCIFAPLFRFWCLIHVNKHSYLALVECLSTP